jgi:uncharacterized DUF497 family protein
MARYEWNREKAETNRAKHRVSFPDAIPALEDPHRIEMVDDRFDYGETRVRVIGSAPKGVLFVVVTDRSDDTCRIISARKATQYEQDLYARGDRESW